MIGGTRVMSDSFGVTLFMIALGDNNSWYLLDHGLFF